MEQPPLPPPSQTAVTSSMQHIPQKIHQLQEGISIRPIIVCIRNVWDIKKHQTDSTRTSIGFMCYDHNGQLLEGRVTGDIQPNDSKNLTEGDSYEFSRFYVIHNSRQRKLTQLSYYIQIGQRTTALNVTLDGPMFPVHSLSPQKYTNLLRLASTPTYLPDVVGQIVIIQKIKLDHPELNIDATIGLRLNRSTIVKLILCDQQAADFSILQSKKNRKFKVMIITSVIPKLIQGKLILHSSPATVFYFNKSIDYIKHFKRRIRDYAKTCSTE
ncbi:hypothetical protein IGI04_004137 [Brassica rapa subsp. trilocularis]|uniref:DUF223 domain-containing protein n=1 Tax=Brassica rapa subsp. trilocularis TaxID=1813537 RepID=A0ABQ7P0E2_BRACM|nr:hypothetical protein IGI04_004137 [Brassica rapa subsp. trilocularis]